ncbi:MAG: DUF6894 family protein [Brevundimonas sp.]
MPAYFFHLVDGQDLVLDPDGTQLNADRVEEYALLNARDCIAGDAKSGTVDLRYQLEVHDEAGEVVHRLAFADAVKVVAD